MINQPAAMGRFGQTTFMRARPSIKKTVVRLWLPLTLLFLLLAPFALLLIPLAYWMPRPRGVSPARAVFALGAVLLSLGGTAIDIQTPRAVVRIKII
jgi:hypothetical protein